MRGGRVRQRGHGRLLGVPPATVGAACKTAGVTATLNDPQAIQSVLTNPGTWAVVGLSGNASRTAYRIAHWLDDWLGHTIIPIHPSAETVFGQRGYRSLAEIPDGTQVDVVDCFLRSELVGAVVDQTNEHRERLGIRMVWLQLGVIDAEAAERAAAAGLEVVMDTCPKIEYPKLASKLSADRQGNRAPQD